MFHILNKTYIDYQECFKFGEDCIQLYDKTYDEVVYDTKVGKALSGELAKRIHICESVSSLENFYGNAEAMFQAFVNHVDSRGNSQLRIFCTRTQYNEFIIRFWKTLFKDMSAKEAYKMYLMYKNRKIFASEVARIRFTDKTDKELHLHYWFHDEKSFERSWESFKAFDVNFSNFIEHLSIEFLLANYLLGSRDEALVNALTSKIERNFSKRVIREVQDFKFELEEALYNLNDYFPGLKFSSYHNFDWEKITKQIPQLEFIQKYELRNAKTIEELVSLTSFDNILFVLDAIKKSEDRVSDGTEYVTPALDLLIKNNKQMPSLDQIVQLELDHKKYSNHGLISLHKLATNDKANGYLLREILFLKKANLMDALKKFSLYKDTKGNES